jgi:hypothetical protein
VAWRGVIDSDMVEVVVGDEAGCGSIVVSVLVEAVR